jgi:hypothetical protein
MLKNANGVLFGTQRGDRVDTCGAASRKDAGEDADADEHNGNRRDDRRVGRLYLEQKTANRAADEKGGSHTRRQADDDRRHALADDQLEHTRALRAERHPDPDLIPAPGDRVRDNAVNAQAGNEQADAAKAAMSVA